jgi:hypothetical protein
LVIVDEENRVLGVLSLSDILTFIVLKQEKITETCSNLSLSSINNGGTQTPTNVHAIIEEETDSKHTKTAASLTAAFGLTRLMDNSNLMNSNDIDDSAFLQANHIQPILTQPTSSKNMEEIDEQSIFEDDPMEDDTQQQNTTAINS